MTVSSMAKKSMKLELTLLMLREVSIKDWWWSNRVHLEVLVKEDFSGASSSQTEKFKRQKYKEQWGQKNLNNCVGTVPGQHHEDEKPLFLLKAQPSQDFWYTHLDGSARNVLLVLFSKHSKPGRSQVRCNIGIYKLIPNVCHGFQKTNLRKWISDIFQELFCFFSLHLTFIDYNRSNVTVTCAKETNMTE